MINRIPLIGLKSLIKTRVNWFFYMILLFSFFMRTEDVLKSANIGKYLKICILFLFSVIILIRILERIRISMDEKLAIIFFLYCLFAGLVNGAKFCDKSYLIPKEFIIVYIGISSYIKISGFSIADLKRVLLLFLILFTIHELTGLYKLFFTNESNPFMRGFFRNSNTFGFLCMSSCMASIASFIIYINDKNKRMQYISLFFILLSFFTLFFSFSRASILGLFVYLMISAVLFFLYKKNHEFRIPKEFCFILVAFIIFLIIFFILSGAVDYYLSKMRNLSSSRLDFWGIFINEQLMNFPSKVFVFGKGFCPASINPVSSSWNMNNFFLESWGRVGFTGLIIFMIFMVYVVRSGFSKKTIWYMSGISLGFLVNNLFESQIIFTNTNVAVLFFNYSMIFSLNYNESI